jgi:hypothetical protein
MIMAIVDASGKASSMLSTADFVADGAQAQFRRHKEKAAPSEPGAAFCTTSRP